MAPAAWLSAALAGCFVPAGALLLMPGSPPVAPLVAVGLMGAGMIGAAAAGRLEIGLVCALVAGAGLVALAHMLGAATLTHPAPLGLAFLIAAISFAARGALFARSAQARGWWIALAVVGGEGTLPTGHVRVSAPPFTCVSKGSGKGSRTAAFCKRKDGLDLSCAMVRSGKAARWQRYWGNHTCS